MTDKLDEILYCDGCRFACQASDCECICHDERWVKGANFGLKKGKEAGRKEMLEKRLVCAKKQNDQIHGEPLEYCHKCVSNTDYLYERIAQLEAEIAKLKAIHQLDLDTMSENTRLREALEKIGNYKISRSKMRTDGGRKTSYAVIIGIAKKALEGKP